MIVRIFATQRQEQCGNVSAIKREKQFYFDFFYKEMGGGCVETIGSTVQKQHRTHQRNLPSAEGSSLSSSCGKSPITASSSESYIHAQVFQTKRVSGQFCTCGLHVC